MSRDEWKFFPWGWDSEIKPSSSKVMYTSSFTLRKPEMHVERGWGSKEQLECILNTGARFSAVSQKTGTHPLRGVIRRANGFRYVSAVDQRRRDIFLKEKRFRQEMMGVFPIGKINDERQKENCRLEVAKESGWSQAKGMSRLALGSERPTNSNDDDGH